MARSRLFNFIIAILFYLGAGLFVSAATVNNVGKRITTAAQKKKTAIPEPARGQPAPGRARKFDRNLPKSAYRKTTGARRSVRTAFRKTILPAIREFANLKIGLRYISSNVKDSLSLIFSMIGTFFTWRSYRIQKNARRNQSADPAG